MRSLAIVALALAISSCGLRTVKGPISGKSYHVGFLGEEYEQELRQFYVLTHPGTPEKFRHAILAKKVMIGMSEEQARIAWMLHESANLEVHEMVGPWGVHKQYAVRAKHGTFATQFLYFENGTLTSWQD